MALEAYEAQAEEAELVEGRYKARNAEIAVQFLNTALNAANSRGTLKANKDKLRVAEAKVSKGGGGTTNNTIVGTTSEILALMRDAQKKEQDPKVINQDED